MEDINRLIILYDYYGELLTDSQKEYFEDYYFNNLSLGEIAENLNVSRNAVHKQLKACEEKLNMYEKVLCLKEKSDSIKELINNISEIEIKEKIIKILEGE